MNRVTWYTKWCTIWCIRRCIRRDSLFGMWHRKWLMAIGRFYLGSVATSNGSASSHSLSDSSSSCQASFNATIYISVGAARRCSLVSRRSLALPPTVHLTPCSLQTSPSCLRFSHFASFQKWTLLKILFCIPKCCASTQHGLTNTFEEYLSWAKRWRSY